MILESAFFCQKDNQNIMYVFLHSEKYFINLTKIGLHQPKMVSLDRIWLN